MPELIKSSWQGIKMVQVLYSERMHGAKLRKVLGQALSNKGTATGLAGTPPRLVAFASLASAVSHFFFLRHPASPVVGKKAL